MMLKTLLALSLCTNFISSPAQGLTDSTLLKPFTAEAGQRLTSGQRPPLPSPDLSIFPNTHAPTDTIQLEITDHFAVRGKVFHVARVERFDSTFLIQKIEVDTVYRKGLAEAKNFYVINSLPPAEDLDSETLYILKPSRGYWYRGGRNFQLPPRMQLFEIAKVHHPESPRVVLKYPKRQRPENLEDPMLSSPSHSLLGITFPLFKPAWQRTFEKVVIPDWERVQGNL